MPIPRNMNDLFVSPLVWPFKKIMTIARGHPRVLAKVLLVIGKFPRLSDWLYEVATRYRIIASPEEDELEQIQSVSELAPEALVIFERLKEAYSDKAGIKL